MQLARWYPPYVCCIYPKNDADVHRYRGTTVKCLFLLPPVPLVVGTMHGAPPDYVHVCGTVRVTCVIRHTVVRTKASPDVTRRQYTLCHMLSIVHGTPRACYTGIWVMGTLALRLGHPTIPRAHISPAKPHFTALTDAVGSRQTDRQTEAGGLAT